MALPLLVGQNYDIQISQGDTFTQPFGWREEDGETPVDLSGFTGRAQVREFNSSRGRVLLEMTVVVDGPAGNFVLSAPDDATAKMQKSGFYSIKFTNGA